MLTIVRKNLYRRACDVARCSTKQDLCQQQRYLASVTTAPPEQQSDNLRSLQPKVAAFVEFAASLCRPEAIHICNGTDQEHSHLTNVMLQAGIIERLPKLHNSFLARTDPADVARVESKTFIVTNNSRDTVPEPQAGVKGMLGNWMSPQTLDAVVKERFPDSMRGRTMYVIPFCMGPVGSPMAKIGIQCTDSPYVVASMRIMTRMGARVLETLGSEDFVKCLHSVGCPLPSKREIMSTWPCNPQQTVIAHVPQSNEIYSYGSGYGGNSLLGKKCFALRIGSTMARTEGWLAEHMLILGITNPQGVKRYVAAAFPSACGKTNLAMMTPSLPGYKVQCVGDDIAWMKFDQEGQLRAINPENGFFGVAPGTSMKTNPIGMKTIQSNTLFTNVAKTNDGDVFWEGLEKEISSDAVITSWTGLKNWTKSSGKTAAHPNSRFCTPAFQCPNIDPMWEDPKGVPISAILFGSRRPKGIPLVYEARSWKHGVMMGAAMRSEATAAAEHKTKAIMHDPFAMRPFFGYNFGHYLQHWLNMDDDNNRSLPKIFHVNWFRKNNNGEFLWPGFGENIRVLDWVMQRLDGKDVATDSAVGLIPSPGSMNMSGLEESSIDMNQLFSIPKEFWQKEVEDIKKFFHEQVGEDMPADVLNELENLSQRLKELN